jgi:hypothetical protein
MISGQTMYKTPKTRYVISLKDIINTLQLSIEKKENKMVSIIVPVLSEEGYVFENEEGVQRVFRLAYQDKYRYESPDGVIYVIYPKFPSMPNGLILTEAQIKHKYHKESVVYSSTINEVKMYNFYVAGR